MRCCFNLASRSAIEPFYVANAKSFSKGQKNENLFCDEFAKLDIVNVITIGLKSSLIKKATITKL